MTDLTPQAPASGVDFEAARVEAAAPCEDCGGEGMHFGWCGLGPMLSAIQRQGQRAQASARIDRTGWTQEQWIEDADRLMNEADGAITSLVNGHVMALLEHHRDWLRIQENLVPATECVFPLVKECLMVCPTDQRVSY